MTTLRVCALYKVAAKQRCSGYQDVYYCTREHQISDWKKHSNDCRPCALVGRPASRPHFVATRNIKIGETVFVDKNPLVTGPCAETIALKRMQNPAMTCSACYDDVPIEKAKYCSKCRMPLCRDCTRHGGECYLTVKYGKRGVVDDLNGIKSAYKVITILRVLALRDLDPKSYQKLLTLEGHCIGDARRKNPMDKAGMDKAGKVAKLIKMSYNFKDLEEPENARIAAIVQMKGHVMELWRTEHRAVYFKASYMDHSC